MYAGLRFLTNVRMPFENSSYCLLTTILVPFHLTSYTIVTYLVCGVFPSGTVIAFSLTQPTVAIARSGAPSVDGDSVNCALFCGASS